jgi:predicted alpha/beta-fold hydrolase
VYPCFVERRFEEDQVQVFYDIEYGSAWNNLTESEQTLTLDAYLPPGGPVPAAAATLQRPARRGGCQTALQKACGADRGSIFGCAKCAGLHQHVLQRAGCSNGDIAAWCAGISPPPPPAPLAPPRPTVVLIHGGSFESGDSQSDGIPDFAMEFATRGYAVVSINYRLEGELYGLETLKSGLVAQEDARAAIRFVRANAEEYNLDPQR